MEEVLHLINEMSPFLLLGFLFAGLLHAFVPQGFYRRYLSGKGVGPVARAALIGVPLPLCSCGVIPTAMSLRKQGASRGAVASFLIATPQTGVDSILATAAMLGIPFAVMRPLVALVTALFGGVLVDKVADDEVQHNDSGEEHCCCHHQEEKSSEEEHCCCHHQEEKPSVEEHCCCHHQEEKTSEDGHCCCHHQEEESSEEEHCCCHQQEKEPATTFVAKMRKALNFAFVEMVEDIGKWLVVGLVVAAAITIAVPDEWFVAFKDNTLLSMLLVLVISIPMYVCATGSIPIAVALMAKGLTPGAALVLLMAGPAANFASILVLRAKLGTRSLIAYLTAIVTGAIAFGCIIDWLLPREWFMSNVMAITQHEGSGTPIEWACTALLAVLLIYSLVIQRFKGHSHEHKH